jgi:hypothetical protein
MKRILLCALTAVAVSASAFTVTAALGADNQLSEAAKAERMQHWEADHETMMEARLAGMKAGLKLNAEQYKLWEPFETAVRDMSKARMERMRKMMTNREHMSPVERMDAMAENMAQGATELKAIAAAAKPFFGSLDETQKRNFTLLGRAMMMSEREEEHSVGETPTSWDFGNW